MCVTMTNSVVLKMPVAFLSCFVDKSCQTKGIYFDQCFFQPNWGRILLSQGSSFYIQLGQRNLSAVIRGETWRRRKISIAIFQQKIAYFTSGSSWCWIYWHVWSFQLRLLNNSLEASVRNSWFIRQPFDNKRQFEWVKWVPWNIALFPWRK